MPPSITQSDQLNDENHKEAEKSTTNSFEELKKGIASAIKLIENFSLNPDTLTITNAGGNSTEISPQVKKLLSSSIARYCKIYHCEDEEGPSEAPLTSNDNNNDTPNNLIFDKLEQFKTQIVLELNTLNNQLENKVAELQKLSLNNSFNEIAEMLRDDESQSNLNNKKSYISYISDDDYDFSLLNEAPKFNPLDSLEVSDLAIDILAKYYEKDIKKISAPNEGISKLKDQINELQSENTTLQKKEVYDKLKDNQISKISILKTKTQETQQQLETSQQEIENLNKKIKSSENKTKNWEKKSQGLQRKENPMPSTDSPLNEEISFDQSSLPDTKKNHNPRLFSSLNSSIASLTNPISDFPSQDLAFLDLAGGSAHQESPSGSLNNTYTRDNSESEEDPEDLISFKAEERPSTESIISLVNTPMPIPTQQMDRLLPASEIESILDLQYSDSPQEMILGLQVKSPRCSIDDRVDDHSFKDLRLMLRKKALETLHKPLPEDTDIIDLNAETWLEKKLHLITGKSIHLKLDPKLQKNLDNKFSRQFPLTSLVDEAITHKSLSELEEALKKFKALKVLLAKNTYKIFSEIDNHIAKYPNLIDPTDISGFLFKLKINLIGKITLEINEEKIQALLFGINKRLENDRNKWNSLDNKLIEEIADEILTLDKNPFGSDKKMIKILITHTLAILWELHDLQGTLNNREKWQADIQWIFAFKQKLDAFNREINIRIAKLNSMQDLKQQDESAVYLPHSCSIISSSDESHLSPYDFTIKGGAFYKQIGLNIGKKLTFEQTLSNNEKRTWSVCPTDDHCLAYTTHKPLGDAVNNVKVRMGYETSYVKEISFAQMIHAVNSFKEGSLCTLQFGQCSSDMEKKIRLFVAAYNELSNNKGPVLIANSNPILKMELSEIEKAKAEIKDKLNLYTHELDSANKQFSHSTAISAFPTFRSRG